MARYLEQRKHPAEQIRFEIEKEKQSTTIQFCFAYYKDLEEAYAFYCARYENIKYNEFLNLGIDEFKMKLASLPETEPLYKIMQSRIISTNSIKDKEQKRYWQKMKSENRIPDIYLPSEYINRRAKSQIKEGGNIQK
jgi:hypothetical protein